MALPAAIGILLAFAQVQPNVDVVSEAGGGEAPVLPGQAPEAGVAAVVTPSGELQLGEGNFVFTARYSPRISWRQPNATDTDRPLLLHALTLSANLQPERAFKLEATGTLNVGDADYTTLTSVLGPTQMTLPDVQQLLVASLGLDLSKNFTPLTVIGARLDLGHRRTLNQPEPDPTTPPAQRVLFLSRQSWIAGGPYLGYRLSPRDVAQLLLEVSYEQRVPDIAFTVAFVSVGWERLVAPRQTLSLFAGAAYTRVTQGDGMGGRDSSTDVYPIATASYDARLYRSQDFGLRGLVSAVVETVIDPVLTSASPRGTLQGQLAMAFSPRWQLLFDAGFGTSLRGDPIQLDPAVTNPFIVDETAVSASLTLRHRLSPWVSLDARARWSDRGPHLEDPNFEFHQRELWFSLGATVTTRRAPPVETSTP